MAVRVAVRSEIPRDWKMKVKYGAGKGWKDRREVISFSEGRRGVQIGLGSTVHRR